MPSALLSQLTRAPGVVIVPTILWLLRNLVLLSVPRWYKGGFFGVPAGGYGIGGQNSELFKHYAALALVFSSYMLYPQFILRSFLPRSNPIAAKFGFVAFCLCIAGFNLILGLVVCDEYIFPHDQTDSKTAHPGSPFLEHPEYVLAVPLALFMWQCICLIACVALSFILPEADENTGNFFHSSAFAKASPYNALINGAACLAMSLMLVWSGGPRRGVYLPVFLVVLGQVAYLFLWYVVGVAAPSTALPVTAKPTCD